MIVDSEGYRLNVGIILINNTQKVFWGRRCGNDSWQFPQGGMVPGETTLETLYRELYEEIGLEKSDVEILGVTKKWLKYQLPEQYIRYGKKPKVVGQRQKWYLLRLNVNEQKISLDKSDTPEFDSWKWVDYEEPTKNVVFFKQEVYRKAMNELKSYIRRKPKFFLSKRRRF